VEALSAALFTAKPVEISFWVFVSDFCVAVREARATREAEFVRIEVIDIAHFRAVFANAILT
jgi:hypothetical protein